MLIYIHSDSLHLKERNCVAGLLEAGRYTTIERVVCNKLHGSKQIVCFLTAKKKKHSKIK